MKFPKVDVGDLLMVDMEKVLKCDMNPYIPFWREQDRIGNIAFVSKLDYRDGVKSPNTAYGAWIKPTHRIPAGQERMLELEYMKVIKKAGY
jgi:hypothetical protein